MQKSKDASNLAAAAHD